MLKTWGGHGGFYQPGYRDGAKLCLQMMCLGKNGDPQTKSYEEFQSINGAKPPTVPDILKKLVGEALHASTAIIREGRVRNPADALPWMEPDICFVNFYAQSGKLGLHQIAELIKDELWPNPLRYFNNDADDDFDGDEDDDEDYRK